MYSLYISFRSSRKLLSVYIPSEQATCGRQIKVSTSVWFSDSTAYQYPMTMSFLDQNVTNFDYQDRIRLLIKHFAITY